MTDIAVVIPAYNAAGFIGEALESVLVQTRKAKEIIVVDDASRDDTAEIVNGYGGQIRLLVNPVNVGQGASRNRAIRVTDCHYIALLDADDKWRDNHLEATASLLDRFGAADVAFSRLQNIGQVNDVWPPLEKIAGWSFPLDLFIPLMREQFFMPSGTIYRRSIHGEVGYFDETRPYGSEDADFFCRVAVSKKFIGSAEPTALYRWHESQNLKKNWVPHVVKYFEYRAQLLDRLQQGQIRIGDLSMAKERTAMQWERYLDRAWAERKILDLRQMISFAIRRRYLLKVTKPYLWRAVIPISLTHRSLMRSVRG